MKSFAISFVKWKAHICFVTGVGAASEGDLLLNRIRIGMLQLTRVFSSNKIQRVLKDKVP